MSSNNEIEFAGWILSAVALIVPSWFHVRKKHASAPLAWFVELAVAFLIIAPFLVISIMLAIVFPVFSEVIDGEQ